MAGRENPPELFSPRRGQFCCQGGSQKNLFLQRIQERILFAEDSTVNSLFTEDSGADSLFSGNSTGKEHHVQIYR